MRPVPTLVLLSSLGLALSAPSQPARADGIDRDAGIIWFVTDVRGAKDDEIGAAHDIGLVFIDEADHVYLSITGRAFVTRVFPQTKSIWRKTDDAWFTSGPDDPNVRLLRVERVTGELWDGHRARRVRFSNLP